MYPRSVAKAKKRGSGKSQRPVIVVSNRLPFTYTRNARGLERKQSPGGLVSALDPVLRRRGGTWVGWPGTDLRPDEQLRTDGEPYQITPVNLSNAEVTGYYHGFSNQTLWPLMHSMADRTRFDSHRRVFDGRCSGGRVRARRDG